MRQAYLMLAAFFVVGLMVFSGLTARDERRRNEKEAVDRGTYLVNLVSAFPVAELQANSQHALFKTLAENLVPGKLAYVYIHDARGKTIVSFAPAGSEGGIPEHVVSASLQAQATLDQRFEDQFLRQKVHEFAKPLFEKGRRVGTVRLGISLPPVSLFSAGRVSVLATIGFLMAGSLILGYYVIIVFLRRIKNPPGTAAAQPGESAPPEHFSKKGIISAIEHLDMSLELLRTNLQEVQNSNFELQSSLGVIELEKRRTLKMLDSINIGIVILNLQDKVIHMNQHMLNLMKKPLKDVIDRPLADVLGQKEVLSFLSEQENSSGRLAVDSLDIEFPDLAPGQSFRMSCSAFIDRDGTLLGKTISIRNITNEKAAEKAKRDFIAHLAHELRNPLTSILSYNDLLMKGEVTDPEMQKEFFNTIDNEAKRLTRLVQDFLDISRMELGSMTLKKTRVKTDWLVEDCLPVLEAAAAKKKITVQKQLPNIYPVLIADKELLKVAVVNILGNAVKYTPESGTVKFSLSEKDGQVYIEVTDSGYGIGPQDLPHIFEKFYRANDANIATQQGTGLGLSITSEIVQLHGGEITVQSELGKGSHFTIRLPREEYYVGELAGK